MSGRGTANLLTRTTAILAAIFMALALVLALLGRGGGGGSILEGPTSAPPPVHAAAPAPAKPAAPPASAPAKPAVPPAAPPGPAVPTQ